MEYLDFDLEIQQQKNGAYPIEAHSEIGDARQVMRLPFDEQALDYILLRIQNALLRSASLHRAVLSPEEQLVEDFGRVLFETLLAADLRHLYNATLTQANQQGKGLRLRLHILAPELALLPWEFLYDPLRNEFVCFLPEAVIVRHLEIEQSISPMKVTPPLRVLAMVASPKDQAPLDVDHERQRLINALSPLEQRNLVRLHWVQGQTSQALHEALLQRDWHIFHFIGHGALDPQQQEGVLALANEQGKTSLLSATDLGRLLALRQSLRLVVLNTCQGAMGDKRDIFSSTAATLASKRIPAVLAMQYDISDRAAIEFTRGFYSALAVGLPVDESVTHARAAIRLGAPKTLEWVTPVLYLRSASGAPFDIPQPTTSILAPGIVSTLLPPVSTALPPHTIPAAPIPQPALPPSSPGAAVPSVPAAHPRVISRRAALAGAGGIVLAAASGGILWWTHLPPGGSTTAHHQSSTPSATAGGSTPGRTATPAPTSPPGELGKTFVTYTGHSNYVYSVAWSPNGKRIASGSGDTTMQVWDAATGQNAFIYKGHSGTVYSVAWSPDSKRIVSASADWTLKTCDDVTGANVLLYPGHTSTVSSVAWSPDGKRIASGGSVNDYSVQVSDATSGLFFFSYIPGAGGIYSVVGAPNSKDIASTSYEAGLEVWDANTQKNLSTYSGYSGITFSVAWSPDGKRIAAAKDDTTVQVWDAYTGANPFIYKGHSSTVTSVAWSPDGKRIASGSDDNTVQVWDAGTGDHPFIYKGHSTSVLSVTWSPDSSRIASGGLDKTVQVWQAR